MTAACSTIKGHFCSLLVSNIFCDPLFPSLPFAHIIYVLKHQIPFSLPRLPFVFTHRLCLQKVNIQFLTFPKASISYARTVFLTSILCVTPPCIHPGTVRSGLSFEFPFCQSLKVSFPLDCTSSFCVYIVSHFFSFFNRQIVRMLQLFFV